MKQPILLLAILLPPIIAAAAEPPPIATDFFNEEVAFGEILNGLDTGTGWAGPWIDPSREIRIDDRPVPGPKNPFFHTASNQGFSVFAETGKLRPLTRFFAENPLSDPVWIVFTAYNTSTNSVTDQNLALLEGINGAIVQAGHVQGNIVILSGGETIAARKTLFPQGGRGATILLRIDPISGRVDLWINPIPDRDFKLETDGTNHCSGVVGLGGSLQPAVKFILRENTGLRASLDDVAVATESEGPEETLERLNDVFLGRKP